MTSQDDFLKYYSFIIDFGRKVTVIAKFFRSLKRIKIAYDENFNCSAHPPIEQVFEKK